MTHPIFVVRGAGSIQRRGRLAESTGALCRAGRSRCDHAFHGSPQVTRDGGGLSDKPLHGITLAVLAVSGFAVMDAAAKYLGEGYPIGQIIFVRNVFGLLPLLVLLWRNGGLATLRSSQPLLQLLRGLSIFGALVTFFTGLRYLGLAEATAIGFAAPLFITALSVPLLGERVGPHRWSAVLVGFCGVLVMLRPG